MVLQRTAPTGGIVAAPTTSLPEWIGGVRNWDYRYCWLRDATLTLLALRQCGLRQEAGTWRTWLPGRSPAIRRTSRSCTASQGERRLTEFELPWLPGYEGSAPVRIGNAASEQIQIDVFGEVMDALYQARTRVAEERHAWDLRAAARVSREGLDRTRCRHLGDPRRAAALRALEGDGVGRVRPRRAHGRDQGLDGPVDHWRQVRDEIHAEVCERGYDESSGRSRSRTDRRSSTRAC